METKKEYNLKVGDCLIANYGNVGSWDNVLVEIVGTDGVYFSSNFRKLKLQSVHNKNKYCYVPDSPSFHSKITHYFPKSREIELNFGEEK